MLDKQRTIAEKNQLYEEVLAAIEEGDDPKVIDRGLAFVAQLSSEQFDPRKEQVTTFVREAGLREIMYYVSSGEDQKADHLLDHLQTIEYAQEVSQ